jgi:trehalose 6-phosphate phosphatase
MKNGPCFWHGPSLGRKRLRRRTIAGRLSGHIALHNLEIVRPRINPFLIFHRKTTETLDLPEDRAKPRSNLTHSAVAVHKEDATSAHSIEQEMGDGTDGPRLAVDSALFLDVDGTLVEIAPTPDLVRVEPALIEALGRLRRRLPVALVSGRTIANLDTLFQPLVLPAAGVHGLERRRSDGVLVGSGEGDVLEPLRRAVAEFAEAHPGVVLEDKGLSLAIHYRLAPAAEDAALALTAGIVAGREAALRRIAGKMVVEIQPRRADKGSAIAAFMAEPPFAGRRPVFVGDDATDEDGFAAVNGMGGHSILVGSPRQTAAGSRLASVAAVHRWLARSLDSDPRNGP